MRKGIKEGGLGGEEAGRYLAWVEEADLCSEEAGCVREGGGGRVDWLAREREGEEVAGV